MINVFKIFLIVALLFSGSLMAAGPKTQDQPHLLQKAQKYPLSGTLMQTKDGYVYLKVDNNYIIELLKHIHTNGRLAMPSSMTTKKGIGAHISVFYAFELKKKGIVHLPELGKQFHFVITQVQTIDQQVERNKRLWVLEVKSPELEALRKSYGLSPLLKGHQFHITLGMETKKKSKK